MLFRVLPLIFFLMCMSMDVHAHSALVRALSFVKGVLAVSQARCWMSVLVSARHFHVQSPEGRAALVQALRSLERARL